GAGFVAPVDDGDTIEDILAQCQDAEEEVREKKKKEEEKKCISAEEGRALMNKSIAALHPDRKYTSYITSSKVTKMIEILREIEAEDETVKTIIFSQFTSMLDIIEEALYINGMSSFLRYDGSMSSNERSDAIDSFFDQEDIPIMLVSLKAGAVGLNLTRASRVIMMDVWWNPAVEDQAIDRVHRIGQTRDVKVYRLTIQNTIEDRILALQENKRAIAAGALGEGDLKVGRLSLSDLRFLFTNDQAFLAPVSKAAEAAAEAAAVIAQAAALLG
ncbi:hypothetical protein HDU98_004671, partial [Podochytrium sp. JEL0797]